MWNALFNAAGAVGNAIDLPGSSVRDALAGRNPLDQWATPLTDKNRTSGRDLLRVRGLAGSKDTWGNFAGGMLTEAALDPLNFIPGMSVAKAAKAKGVAQAANRGIDAANATSMSQRAAGFMPEETIQHLHPSVLGPDGMPRTFYHGTPDISFEKHDLKYDNGGNLYGKGIYSSDSTRPAGHPDYGYWKKGMDSKMRYELPDSARPDFEEAIRSSQRDGIRRDIRSIGYSALHKKSPQLRHLKEDVLEAFRDRHKIQDGYIQRAHESLQKAGVLDQRIPMRARGYLEEVPPPAGVKKHFVDLRNPLDIDNPAAGIIPYNRESLRSGISYLTEKSRKLSDDAELVKRQQRLDLKDAVEDAKNSRDAVADHVRKAQESEEWSRVNFGNNYQRKPGAVLEDANRLAHKQGVASRIKERAISEFIDRHSNRHADELKAMADEARVGAMFMFGNRHIGEPVGGQQLWNRSRGDVGLKAVNDVLATKHGYDGIVHEGGKNFRAPPGVDPRHNVAIAFKPEQMYLPYIAKSIQQPLPVPKITPAMMRLAMYNAAARTAAQSGRTK